MVVRNSLAIVVGVLAWGSAALAQPDVSPPTLAPAPPPAASLSPTTPKLDGHTVSGVTVEAKPLKIPKCGARDNACIAEVVAELRQRYPKELRQWCSQEEMKSTRANFMGSEFLGSADHPMIDGSFAPPAVTRIACFPPKKP